MSRTPQYLELRLPVERERRSKKPAAEFSSLWWLIAMATVLALLLIGVGRTNGVL